MTTFGGTERCAVLVPLDPGLKSKSCIGFLLQAVRLMSMDCKLELDMAVDAPTA